MTPETIQAISDALAPLAQRLGTASSVVWESLLKQQVVVALGYLLIATLLSLTIFFIHRYCQRALDSYLAKMLAEKHWDNADLADILGIMRVRMPVYTVEHGYRRKTDNATWEWHDAPSDLRERAIERLTDELSERIKWGTFSLAIALAASLIPALLIASAFGRLYNPTYYAVMSILNMAR